MRTYLLTAVGVIFFSVIVSIIIPEGKLNKTITFIMRIACILVLIQPISGIFKIGSSDAANKPMYDYTYISKVYSNNQSSELEKLLNEKFSQNTDCSVDVGYEDGEFKVRGVNVELNSEDEQKLNEIYEYLEELGYINITVYAKSD